MELLHSQASTSEAAHEFGGLWHAYEALRQRPNIPADQADISEIQALAATAPAEEPGYAWERLPLWLAEVGETYDKIGKAPILGLDLCSSLPMYAQILRSLEFDRDGVRARELISELFSERAVKQLAEQQPDLKPLDKALQGQHQTRKLLESALQEALYEITIDEATGAHYENPLFANRLGTKLRTQRHIYHRAEAAQGVEIGRGFRVFTEQKEASYSEKLATLRLPVQSPAAQAARKRLSEGRGTTEDMMIARRKYLAGPKLADRYMQWQVDFLAQRIVGNKRYRPARFFSMDASDPEAIAISSVARMPSPTQSLDVFTHAVASLQDPTQHLRGNIFDELPFPDNSLALITCFDAWPFHFQRNEQLHDPHADVGTAILDQLLNLYNKLAHGGRLVVFPWTIHASDYADVKANARVLRGVTAEFSRLTKQAVDTRQIHRDTLRDWMSASDLETSTRLSPIFSSRDDLFEALIVTKANESSTKAANNWLAKMAVKDQIPDLPDPTR